MLNALRWGTGQAHMDIYYGNMSVWLYAVHATMCNATLHL